MKYSEDVQIFCPKLTEKYIQTKGDVLKIISTKIILLIKRRVGCVVKNCDKC